MQIPPKTVIRNRPILVPGILIIWIRGRLSKRLLPDGRSPMLGKSSAMLSTHQTKPKSLCPHCPRLLGLLIVVLTGCAGSQSTLAPAGEAAERIAQLFWWMVSIAAVIWLIVAGLCLYAIRINPQPHNRRLALLIIGGGVLVPTVVLGVLLAFGLSLLPDLVAPAPEGSLHIEVTGEQWWWRVRYETPDSEWVELANEIHLPVGEPVEFSLKSADVVHAFWIPALGGKVDMIPGRVNRLRLDPTRKGLFRGVCAEYCGGSHSLMAFDVVVEDREDFERWLAHQQQDAKAPSDSQARQGRDMFFSSGCAACHTIRGTNADGAIGPDLTHVGGRKSLAAGTLPNHLEQFHRWLAHPDEVKPEVPMPRFSMLPEDDLKALAAYLEGLE